MNPQDKTIGTPQRQAVLREIKQSAGLTVTELSERIDLSYMGTKQHCLLLEKKGYLSSRNHHRGAGRPVLVYRLTSKGEALFEAPDNAVVVTLLRNAQTLFGPTAAGKLLFKLFQDKGDAYLKGLPADPAERLKKLAAIRAAEGSMSRVDEGVLVEFNNPLSGIFREYPEAAGLEENMIGRVLGRKVRRAESASGGIRFEYL
ncbi:MAG: winged helix-turn-helix transcriptional regulator [Terrimicrobiaceae bacterium]|nr:winged helix-turn-helix transcriptional regulator [Terrimicrobiaceae bacterium]